MKNLKGLSKKVLVIGISSYVGRGISIYLAKKNYDVVGSYNINKPKYITDIKLIKLDLTKKNTLNKIPKDINIIVNCACIRKKYYKNLSKIVNNYII